jgi:hypothetical protein
MGYDLHITRRAKWTEEGNDIRAEEWLAYVSGDPEFRHTPENGPYFHEWTGSKEGEWLDWREGQIETKNPSESLIAKMVAVAAALGATVQGDDGERYPRENEQVEPHATAPKEPPRTGWFRELFGRRAEAVAAPGTMTETLPFKVGDLVRDTFGNELRVVAVDPRAEHGLGLITAQNANGVKTMHSMVAHGLELVTRG